MKLRVLVTPDGGADAQHAREIQLNDFSVESGGSKSVDAMSRFDEQVRSQLPQLKYRLYFLSHVTSEAGERFDERNFCSLCIDPKEVYIVHYAAPKPIRQQMEYILQNCRLKLSEIHTTFIVDGISEVFRVSLYMPVTLQQLTEFARNKYNFGSAHRFIFHRKGEHISSDETASTIGTGDVLFCKQDKSNFVARLANSNVEVPVHDLACPWTVSENNVAIKQPMTVASSRILEFLGLPHELQSGVSCIFMTLDGNEVNELQLLPSTVTVSLSGAVILDIVLENQTDKQVCVAVSQTAAWTNSEKHLIDYACNIFFPLEEKKPFCELLGSEVVERGILTLRPIIPFKFSLGDYSSVVNVSMSDFKGTSADSTIRLSIIFEAVRRSFNLSTEAEFFIEVKTRTSTKRMHSTLQGEMRKPLNRKEVNATIIPTNFIMIDLKIHDESYGKYRSVIPIQIWKKLCIFRDPSVLDKAWDRAQLLSTVEKTIDLPQTLFISDMFGYRDTSTVNKLLDSSVYVIMLDSKEDIYAMLFQMGYTFNEACWAIENHFSSVSIAEQNILRRRNKKIPNELLLCVETPRDSFENITPEDIVQHIDETLNIEINPAPNGYNRRSKRWLFICRNKETSDLLCTLEPTAVSSADKKSADYVFFMSPAVDDEVYAEVA
jgi:hypothetical protein